jgi:hypothetical protein
MCTKRDLGERRPGMASDDRLEAHLPESDTGMG